MKLAEKDDVALAGLIIQRYNALKAGAENLSDELEEQISTRTDELYGANEEPDMIEVPVELFHRLAAETEHHKAMLAGSGTGVIATIGASTSGEAYYGISKDIKVEFRVSIRAPEGKELTDEEIDEIMIAATDGARATLVREADALKAEIRDLAERFKTTN